MEKVLCEKINYAKLICLFHEDTQECKVAWDQVEDYARAVRKLKTPPPKKPYTERALRIYDC